jgi:glyoxylase-like metal-dependent hydrolase (beta-lactamase superfamily II)
MVEVVAPGVRRLLANNPSPMTGRGTNTYLLGGETLVVVDPGPDLPEHVDAIASQGRIAFSLVTHAHQDHLPGALRLREQTGAPIIGHAALPGVDRALADGEGVDAAGTNLVALATPGHAPEHLCFWDEAQRLLFTGDLIAGAGTIVLADAPNALTHYLDSLARIRALGASTLLPGHGPVVADGLKRIESYVQHRLARERELLAALAAGPTTVDGLVATVYAGLQPELLGPAARNVRAHLERLVHLGRVAPDGDAWRRLD